MWMVSHNAPPGTNHDGQQVGFPVHFGVNRLQSIWSPTRLGQWGRRVTSYSSFRGLGKLTPVRQTDFLTSLLFWSGIKEPVWQASVCLPNPLNDEYDVTRLPHSSVKICSFFLMVFYAKKRKAHCKLFSDWTGNLSKEFLWFDWWTTYSLTESHRGQQIVRLGESGTHGRSFSSHTEIGQCT